MSHVTRSRWFSFAMGILCTLAVVAALGGATGVWAGAPAQNPLPPEQEGIAPTSPDAVVARTIPVQGRLTDAGGNPINGSKIITFTLYTGSGTVVCQDNAMVPLANGLFQTKIDLCSAADVNGQALWLGIRIAGEAAEMTPRQPIYPVPYAFSLVPGAEIGGIGADDGSLYLKDAAGVTMIGLTASNGLLDLGGAGDDGDLYVRNSSNTITAQIDGNGGALYLGGTGQAGDIVVREGVSSTTTFGVTGSTGDVYQAITGDGLVKAAAHVYCSTGGASNLARSFNHVAGAITVISGAGAGQCTIDFGFDVSGRFVVATPAGLGARFVSYNAGSTNKRLDFYHWNILGVGVNGDISVLVY